MKKILSALIAFTLIAALLPGCAAKKEAKSETTAEIKKEEIYTYTIAPILSGPVDENAEMVKYWEDRLNCKFKIVYLESNKRTDLLNLKIASGEIPDVMGLGDLSAIYRYQAQGVLGGWDEEFLRKHSPMTAKFIDEKLGQEAWKLSKIDGKMYSIPGSYVHNEFTLPVIWRDDWLKNVGIDTIPKTLEEVEKAFYKFRNGDPDRNGKKDTYALSSAGLYPIYGAFGFINDIWSAGKDGNLVYGAVDPRAKDALALLSKWFKDEILDPEFVTGEKVNVFTGGKIGFTCMNTYNYWREPRMVEKGLPLTLNSLQLKNTLPNASFAFGYPPIGPKGDRGNKFPGSIIYFRSGFSSDLVKNEAKFAKFLKVVQVVSGFEDIIDAVIAYEGMEGKHWIRDAKVNVIRKPEFEDPAARTKFGGHATWNFVANAEYNKYVDVLQYTWAKEVYSDKDRNIGHLNKVMVGLPSAAKYDVELKKIVDECYIQIITGARELNYFDDMVVRWYKQGGEQLTKEANEWYKKVK